MAQEGTVPCVGSNKAGEVCDGTCVDGYTGTAHAMCDGTTLQWVPSISCQKGELPALLATHQEPPLPSAKIYTLYPSCCLMFAVFLQQPVTPSRSSTMVCSPAPIIPWVPSALPPATTVPSTMRPPQSHVSRATPGACAQAHANRKAMVGWVHERRFVCTGACLGLVIQTRGWTRLRPCLLSRRHMPCRLRTRGR